MATARSSAPIVTVVDLPMPPSINRIWQHNKAGKKRVSRSPEYMAWLRQADLHTMATAQLRGTRRINGKFQAEIVLARRVTDLDNRVKGVLDWAESRFVIKNDKHCERLILEWEDSLPDPNGRPPLGDAPAGCRLTVTELSS